VSDRHRCMQGLFTSAVVVVPVILARRRDQQAS
jgi:hypothetical protein